MNSKATPTRYWVTDGWGRPWKPCKAQTLGAAKRAASAMSPAKRMRLRVGTMHADGRMIVVAVRDEWEMSPTPQPWYEPLDDRDDNVVGSYDDEDLVDGDDSWITDDCLDDMRR